MYWCPFKSQPIIIINNENTVMDSEWEINKGLLGIITVMKILLVLLLAVVCLGQKGRGGSSSSRSSSGSSSRSSSSFGGPHRIYSSYHPMIVTRRYGSSFSCQQQCHINFVGNPELLVGCLSVCQQRRNRVTYGILGTIGAIIIGCCACAICNNTARSANTASSQPSVSGGRPNRQLFIQKTKQRLHDISTNYMPLQQFQLQKQNFQNQNWRMHYFHRNKEHFNDTVTFYLKSQGPFIYSLTCRGNDDVGSWSGNGYFFCTPQGIKVWMLKDYDDRVSAEQFGEYELLMYEGEHVSREKYQGKWYYVGFENTFEDSGKWAMVGSYAGTPSNPYVASYF